MCLPLLGSQSDFRTLWMLARSLFGLKISFATSAIKANSCVQNNCVIVSALHVKNNFLQNRCPN